MAKEGSKNQKFFSEKIFERWEKKILGPLGPFLAKIDFGGQGGSGRGGGGGPFHGHLPILTFANYLYRFKCV